MASLQNIVKDAYRESGIIQKGELPDADQMEEGLAKLISLIENVMGEEVGAPFQDLNYGDDGVTNHYSIYSNQEVFVDNTYVKPSYRLLVNSTTPKTVYLDPSPYDGARFSVIDVAGTFDTAPLTVSAETRKIEGSNSVELNTAGTNVSWFYRADLAEWVKVSPLDSDSDSPFPEQFDDYFVIKLATRLHPRYLVKTAQETVMHYRELERKFRSRYSTTEEVNSEPALYRLNRYRYWGYVTDASSLRFNKGIVY